MGIGRRFIVATALAAVGLGAARAQAEIPTFSVTDFDAVKVDGFQVGGSLSPYGSPSQRNSVVYRNGVYHMWLGTQSPHAVTSFRHATSTDGINFTTTPGSLTFAGGDTDPWNDYIEPDTTSTFSFSNVKAVEVGGEYKLMFWSSGGAPSPYTYTVSVNDIGSNASNTVVDHLGPVKNNSANASISSLSAMGVINGNLYTLNDGAAGEYSITRGPAYSDGPQANVASFSVVTTGLVTAAGYTPGTTVGTYIVDPTRNGLVELEEGHLVAFYSISEITQTSPSFLTARVTEQLFALESMDDGLTWSTPVPLFDDTSNFTADGEPLIQGYRHPEAVLVDDQVRLYYSSFWYDASTDTNRLVFVTALSNPIPEPASLGLLAAGAGLVAFRRRSAR